MIIKPFRKNGVWMFDDPETGLVEEPFVKGSGEVLEGALRRAKIWPGSHHGFRLEFSDEPQDGWERADLVRPEDGGAWYECKGTQAWLCPALMLYFPHPPTAISFRVLPMVDPVEINQHYRDQLRDFRRDAETSS